MPDVEAISGKKTFFLYPHSVIENDVIEAIVANEYEVYFLTDHVKAKRVFRRYSDSIVFINIDDGLKEREWEAYVRDLTNSNHDLRVGILTYNDNPELSKKYLMDIGVPGGFIVLRLGVAETTKIILATLQANEAKGRRKFVRASTKNSNKARFNIRRGDKTLSGQILDISVAGMAVLFEGNVDLPLRTVLQDIQLQLWGTLVLVNGVVTAVRKGDGSGYVVMFGSTVSAPMKRKIHLFVHRWLQDEMEQLLERI